MGVSDMSDMSDEKKLLQEASDRLGVPMDARQLDQFMVYQDLLLSWNEKMNLTAITAPRDVVLKHFADCLSIVPHLHIDDNSSNDSNDSRSNRSKSRVRMIDVGTGAGFPGIPVKIACPAVEMVLLDSLQKRIGFLEEVVGQLGLDGVSCVHARAEDGGQNGLYREKFDYCVSRAVANLAVLAEYCLPFVKKGGYLVALKGPDAAQEVVRAEAALKQLGGKLVEVKDVEIPFTDLAHKLIFIQKVANTPKKYPRKAGTVAKEPL